MLEQASENDDNWPQADKNPSRTWSRLDVWNFVEIASPTLLHLSQLKEFFCNSYSSSNLSIAALLQSPAVEQTTFIKTKQKKNDDNDVKLNKLAQAVSSWNEIKSKA